MSSERPPATTGAHPPEADRVSARPAAPALWVPETVDRPIRIVDLGTGDLHEAALTVLGCRATDHTLITGDICVVLDELANIVHTREAVLNTRATTLVHAIKAAQARGGYPRPPEVAAAAADRAAAYWQDTIRLWGPALFTGFDRHTGELAPAPARLLEFAVPSSRTNPPCATPTPSRRAAGGL